MEDWSDAQEIVNGIPEELWSLPSEVMNDYLSAHPDVKAKVLEFLKINFPARYFVPNVGQEKAILPLKTMDISADEMKVGCFAGGNGTGKTTLIPIIMVGAIWGKGELSSFFEGWSVFDKFQMIQKEERRPLMIRIVCDGVQMKDDGGLFSEIKKWFPKGRVAWQKDKASFYQSGVVRASSDKNSPVLAKIQVRTFEQDARVHAGDNVDLILVNEPMPKHLYGENIGRLRTRHGGIFWMFATPLAEGSWIKDKIADDPKHCFTSASLWDNCSDWHPDPDMWTGKEVGIGKVLTRGTRPKSVFDAQIREWEKEGPETVNARVYGAFSHFAGAVVKEFNLNFHTCESFAIPREWPIYCVMDPHNGGKPNFITWWAQDPHDVFYLVDEYPFERWDLCKSGESTSECCSKIRSIEDKFANQVVYRFADPAIAKIPREANGQTFMLQHEFAKNGFRFAPASNDTSVGMSRLRDMLIFDPKHDIDDWNKPHMVLFNSSFETGRPLVNVKTAFNEWTYKEGYSEKDSSTSFTNIVTQKWKDPMDCCRYLAIEKRPYRPVPAIGAKRKSKPMYINRDPRDW